MHVAPVPLGRLHFTACGSLLLAISPPAEDFAFFRIARGAEPRETAHPIEATSFQENFYSHAFPFSQPVYRRGKSDGRPICGHLPRSHDHSPGYS